MNFQNVILDLFNQQTTIFRQDDFFGLDDFFRLTNMTDQLHSIIQLTCNKKRILRLKYDHQVQFHKLHHQLEKHSLSCTLKRSFQQARHKYDQ